MSTIWEKAKDIETKGRDFYIELAGKSSREEVASIFKVLADEEQKHYDLFDSLEKQLEVGELPKSTSISDAKEAFARLASAFKTEDPVEDAESTYAKALELERTSVEYYNSILEQLDDGKQKEAVKTIIGEEQRHERIVEGLMEFVRRPKEWLEDAEFYHLEEY